MQYRKVSFVQVASTLLTLLCPFCALAANPIVFSLRQWSGQYTTSNSNTALNSAYTSSLYTINSDGTGMMKIVDLGKSSDNAQFASNGWIYFQTNAFAPGNYHIARCRPDGSQVQDLTGGQELTPNADSFGFYVSNDAAKIAFVSHDGTTGRESIMNSDGSSPHYLNPSLGYIYMGSFSPDRSKVVVTSASENYRLKLLNADGTNVVSLTPNHQESYGPVFTRDGNSIVFLRRDGDIYKVDTAGANVQRLTTGNLHDSFFLGPQDEHGSTDFPSVSPDGTKIAYVSRATGVAQVWTMNVDGSDQKKITNLPTECARAIWNPDGLSIDFISLTTQNSANLFTVDASGLLPPLQLTNFSDGNAVYFANAGVPEPACAVILALIFPALACGRVRRKH